MLIHRKPGMTPEAFKAYYENTHVPLMQLLTGSLFPLSHTRRYLQRTATPTSDGGSWKYPAAILSGSQEDFGYDTITEMVFEDETAFKRFFDLFAQPDFGAKVAADCGNFMDMEKSPGVILEDLVATKRTES